MKACPRCGSQNQDTARFCAFCAQSLSTQVFCENCGATNPTGTQYCADCGSELSTAQPAPAGSAPPAPALPPSSVGLTGKLPANSMLSGRYLILKMLGQGGMGAVYLASDTRLGSRKVAVKEMSDALIVNPAEKQQAITAFQQEARILSMLSHNGLPRVTDSFSEGDKQYLVMDYIEGKTLEDTLAARTTPFPESQVLDWALQLCDVLDYLHTRTPAIIYRDLKPGNIMVSADGRSVKLIDFGIARLFKPGAGKDTVSIGTPGYAPPEQYGKRQTDARSDIYALGALLHHLLTLRDPGSEPFKFPPVRTLNPQVSQRLNDVIMKAVQLDANDRWNSINQMRSSLMNIGPAAVQPAVPPPAVRYTPPAPVPPVVSSANPYNAPYVPPAPAPAPIPISSANVLDENDFLGRPAAYPPAASPVSAAAIQRSGFIGYFFWIAAFCGLYYGLQELVRSVNVSYQFNMFLVGMIFSLPLVAAALFTKRPFAFLFTGLAIITVVGQMGITSPIAWAFVAGEALFLLGWYRLFGFRRAVMSGVVAFAMILIIYGNLGSFELILYELAGALAGGILAFILAKMFHRI